VETVQIVLVVVGVVVLALGAAVAVRVRRYGGFHAAFNGYLKADRKELAEARARVRSLNKAREAEVAAARTHLDQVTAQRDGRIGQLSSALAELHEPGTGPRVHALGKVAVHTHAVNMGYSWVPLAGARARVQSTGDSAVLYVTDAQGREEMAPFDTRLKDVGDAKVSYQGDVVKISQAQKRDYSAEQVMHLATVVNNAAITETQFVEQRPALIEATAAQLQAVTADTSEMDAATVALQQIEADSEVLADLQAAQRTLTLVETDWAAKSAKPAKGEAPAALPA
jgi:hypothetical protein